MLISLFHCWCSSSGFQEIDLAQQILQQQHKMASHALSAPGMCAVSIISRPTISLTRHRAPSCPSCQVPVAAAVAAPAPWQLRSQYRSWRAADGAQSSWNVCPQYGPRSSSTVCASSAGAGASAGGQPLGARVYDGLVQILQVCLGGGGACCSSSWLQGHLGSWNSHLYVPLLPTGPLPAPGAAECVAAGCQLPPAGPGCVQPADTRTDHHWHLHYTGGGLRDCLAAAPH